MRWVVQVLRVASSTLAILSGQLLLAAEPAPAANVSPAAALTAESSEFFEKRIRPLLTDRCYECHSARAEKLKAGLRLDTRETLLKGGDSGPVIVPGDPERSLLIKAVRYTDDELKMPPKHKLPLTEIADLEAWVKMGAPDPRQSTNDARPKYAIDLEKGRKFWSFQPVHQPPIPAVHNSRWAKTPVDKFILAGLEQKGLSPAPDASKRTLIRRVAFDLTGLPPEPDQVEAFLKDQSPSAFEKVVDRLLASPRYGERWGRHWLDVVRYADTSGCNSDFPVPSAYRYRNYVIDSFNSDKPYPQFIREQIAGDLLPSDTEDQRYLQTIATGYLAISRRFGSRADEFHLTLEDTIDNMGKAFLGLSVGCARCHDHKFDPVPTKDYYALYGIFNSTRFAFPGTEIYRHPKDFVPLTSKSRTEEIYKYQAEVAALDDELEKLQEQKRSLERQAATGHSSDAPKDEKPDDAKERLVKVKADIEDLKTRQQKLEAQAPVYEKAYAVAEGKPADAKLQKKGDPGNKGDVVPRGFLQVLGGATLPTDENGSGRLELAGWLSDSANPLVARVMVNRIWQHHFGRGIVATSNDFGARGKPPTNPELLDYLAAQFIQQGWSMKAIHKLIVLSHAYQVAVEPTHASLTAEKDPENDLLSHFGRRRLDAEEVRDAILFVSGDLDLSRPGPHPFPPENEWHYTQHKPFVAVYPNKHRSVYLMQQRIKKNPFLELFDGADANATVGERPVSTTPLQALFLMNDPFAHEEADRFAVRVAMAFADESRRIDFAYRLSLGRPATSDEMRMAIDFLRQCQADLRETQVPADQQPRAALASFCRVLLSSNEFMFVD
jgi:hypothetical protein